MKLQYNNQPVRTPSWLAVNEATAQQPASHNTTAGLQCVELQYKEQPVATPSWLSVNEATVQPASHNTKLAFSK
jgi:hypothetical protein